jgi:hypothetical protein
LQQQGTDAFALFKADSFLFGLKFFCRFFGYAFLMGVR